MSSVPNRLTARSRAHFLGGCGEDRAAARYVEDGYEIVARNWRCRQGEIDLIVARGATLVFSEVKTRSGSAFGSPLEAVTRVKQLRIRKLAAAFLAQDGNGWKGEIRFDVVAVSGSDIEVHEGVF